MVAARSNLMPQERNQQNQQGGQGGQQQQGGGGQEGEKLKPKPGRGREQHQFESPKYQPQPGHGSPDDPSSEDCALQWDVIRRFMPTGFTVRA